LADRQRCPEPGLRAAGMHTPSLPTRIFFGSPTMPSPAHLNFFDSPLVSPWPLQFLAAHPCPPVALEFFGQPSHAPLPTWNFFGQPSHAPRPSTPASCPQSWRLRAAAPRAQRAAPPALPWNKWPPLFVPKKRRSAPHPATSPHRHPHSKRPRHPCQPPGPHGGPVG